MCRSESCSLPVAAVLPADMPFPRPRVQPMKPRLPRKLATSARINLNKYWHALEELMPVSCRALDESDSNAINENIDNERRLAAMRLSDQGGCCNGGNWGKSSSNLQNSTASSKVLMEGSTGTSVNSNAPPKPSSALSNSSAESRFHPFFTDPEDYPDENTPPSIPSARH